MVSTLITHSRHSKTLATASMIAKGTGGVWKAKHSRWHPEGSRYAAASSTPTRVPTSSADQASMAAATANAGIFCIRMISHELGYVKILINVQLMC